MPTDVKLMMWMTLGVVAFIGFIFFCLIGVMFPPEDKSKSTGGRNYVE